MAQVQRAVVRSLPGEANLTITLTVGGRQRNLDRPKEEPLEKPLLRLQKSATAPSLGKGSKDRRRKESATGSRQEGQQEQTALVALHNGPTPDHPILDPESTTNEAAWRHGRLLRVGDAQYKIEVNPPTIEKIELPGTAFVGVPMVPRVQLQFAELEDCRWEWRRRRHGPTQTLENSEETWELVTSETRGLARGYIPTIADVGYVLQVTCHPGKKQSDGGNESTWGWGQPASAVLGVPVQIPPAPGSDAGRHALTQAATTSPAFRVVTYNILADQYAGTETARTELFASCPPECLESSYRRPLIIGELLGYNADVICLQEVDDKMFTHWLEPVLCWAGFQGVYTNKAGDGVREGSAMFWKRDRFRFVARKDITLKSLFPSSAKDIESAKYGPAFATMLLASPPLCTALQRVATVAQAVILAPCPENSNSQEECHVCFVNTHLFFHYAAPHIRTMHTWAILQEAAELARTQEANQGNNNSTPAVVFCGDLNSDLNDGIPGAVQLLATGGLPADYWDWAFGVNFKWERDPEEEVISHDEGGEVSKMVHTEVKKLHAAKGPTEMVAGVDLRSPMVLAPADRLRSGITNYVRGYQGLLDYVWYDPLTLAVERVVPVPEPSSLGGYIPNRHFPSDHLAVVVDLRFKGHGENPGGGNAPMGGGTGIVIGDSGNYGDEPEGPGSVLPAALYNVTLAVSALREGKMLAVPTDTVYGVAACAAQESGVERIYSAKRRGAHKPLAICVADYDDIPRYCEVGHLPRGLLEDLLPGPVTLVLSRRGEAHVTPALNPGVPSLGIRIPDCRFLRAVCRQHAGALALTSANLSGGASTVAVSEFRELWKECAIVFDGGVISENRSGSTIVDLTVPNEYSIERGGQGMPDVVAILRDKHGLQPRARDDSS